MGVCAYHKAVSALVLIVDVLEIYTSQLYRPTCGIEVISTDKLSQWEGFVWKRCESLAWRVDMGKQRRRRREAVTSKVVSSV